MTVCPKCGFNGQDPDACERCGIIYSRMHTVTEMPPAGAKGAPGQGPRVSGSHQRVSTPRSVPPVLHPQPVEATNLLDSLDPSIDIDVTGANETLPDLPAPGASSRSPLRSVPAISQAFPGMAPMPTPRGSELTPSYTTRPPRENTVVPIVPPPPRKSRAPLLVGLLVVCLVGWGAVKWVDNRKGSAATIEVDESANAEYFQFQIGELVDEARRTFREIKDLDSGRNAQDAFGVRVRYLRTRLPAAALDERKREVVSHALDEIAGFLKDDVGAVLTAMEAAAKPAVAPGEDAPTNGAPSTEGAPADSAPAPSPEPGVEAAPAVATPVDRSPPLTALSRATSILASLSTE
jgi:hypothetical protein